MIIGDGIMLGAGGETASIIVTAPTGSTVTCTTPSGMVQTATEVSGTWAFTNLKVYGTYTITAISETLTKTQDVLVDAADTFNIEIKYYYTFTYEDFANATTMVQSSGRCSFSILTGQYDGTDGLRIYGTNNGNSKDGAILLGFPSYVIKANLTGYSTLSWYFKKVNNHAAMRVCIIKSSPTTSTAYSSCATSKYVSYNDLSTSWTKYSLDVSALTGEYYLLFQSGWWDATGNSNSEGHYSNIRLE